MSNAPERIWLEPCCIDSEPSWCTHKLDDCEECDEKSNEYIRADIGTEQAAEIERLRDERDELAHCLISAIDMLDEYAVCSVGEHFNSPRFNAALAVKP